MARAGFCQKFFKGAEIHQTSGGRRSLDIEELHDSHAAGYENPMISFNWNSSNYQSAFKTTSRYSFPPPHLYMRSLAVQPIIFSRRSNCANFFFGNPKKNEALKWHELRLRMTRVPRSNISFNWGTSWAVLLEGGGGNGIAVKSHRAFSVFEGLGKSMVASQLPSLTYFPRSTSSLVDLFFFEKSWVLQTRDHFPAVAVWGAT